MFALVKMFQNSNDVDADTEKVNCDDNYDYLSQLRVDRNVNEVRSNQKLKVVIPKQYEEPSKATKTPVSSSSHMGKIRIVSVERTWSAPIFSDEVLPHNTPNNTSLSAISFWSIKIGQLFENKGDLKMKLHLMQ